MSLSIGKTLTINPLPDETSWEVHKLIGPEDILNLKITIQSGKGVDSVSKLTPKYIINNAVLFQIRMDTGLASQFEITVTLSFIDQILRPFALLYEDLKSTDLRLIGKDGTIEVHCAILIAYSPVFNRQLCEKAQESTRPYELALPHVKQSTLQHLKDYIYLNNIPDSPLSNITDLINLATEYQMKELSQLCTQKLATVAAPENFYELTYFALNNDMNELFFDILELIENGKIKTEDIKKYSKIDSLSNGL